LNKLDKKNLIKLSKIYNIHLYKATRYLISKEAMLSGQEFTIEKDASNSGLQILSLLLRSKSGAKLCGLIHPHLVAENEVTDIYEYVRNLFILDVNILRDYITKYSEKEISESKDVDQYNLEWLATIKGNTSFIENLTAFGYYVSNHIITLDQRSLWKSLTMPQQYGVTNFSMKNTLINHLRETGTQQNIRYIASLIVRWYQYRVKPRLPLINEYLNVWRHTHKEIKKANNLIKIKNKEINLMNRINNKKNNKIEMINNKASTLHKKMLKKIKQDPKNPIFLNYPKEPICLDYIRRVNLSPYITKIKPVSFTTDTFTWKFQVLKLIGIKVKVKMQQFKIYKTINEHNIAQMFTSFISLFIFFSYSFTNRVS
jgi:hypothetical protein